MSLKADLSKKSTTLLTCGLILIGGFVQVGIPSIITSNLLGNATAEKVNRNDSDRQMLDENLTRLNEDKRFVAIESQLEPPTGFEYYDDGPSSFEMFKEGQNSIVLHELFPLIPGYADYVKAWEESDEITTEFQSRFSRNVLNDEFNYTCDMVADLVAGLDIKQRDEEGYPGKYHGNVNFTPENFETMLKGCGDENLKYLDELQEEKKTDDATQAEIDKEIEKLNNELSQTQEGQGMEP